MKRSSRISLLISVFSLLVATTIGLASSNASQADESSTTKKAPYRVMRNPYRFLPVEIPTWEEKHQWFEEQVKQYSLDQEEWTHLRHHSK